MDLAADNVLPHVYLLPTKFLAAAKTPDDTNTEEGGILEQLPADKLFENIYSTDAHFVSYGLIFNGFQEPAPRLSKTLLPKLRLRGADVAMNMVVLDYDNPDHRKWNTKDERGAFLNKLSEIADEWPTAWNWSVLYFTRGGARLVYILDEIISPEEFEGKHQWICQEFTRRGLPIDCGVSDWTRCFRLPFVTREKELTWESDYADILFQYKNRLDPSKLGTALTLKKTNVYGDVKVYDSEMPDFDEAKRLCEFKDAHGNFLQTDWFKHAKKRLRGRECYDTLFAHAQFVDRGKRDTTLHQFIGQAISLLFYLEGTEPKHIFGLFLPLIEQLEQDDNWFLKSWDHIQRLWAKEEAKDIEIKQVEIEKAQEAKGVLGRIVHGMRKWCMDPRIQSENDHENFSFASRYFIADMKNVYYVMNEHGYYSAMPLRAPSVIPFIRNGPLADLIETRVIGKDGAMGDASVSSVINKHSVQVKACEGRHELEGGFIDGLGTDTAKLVLPTFKRNPKLTPEYNADVDEWLHHFFDQDYEKGKHWISWCLAWDEGCICALSLEGRAGSGKKLFTQGLAECMDEPSMASSDDLVGDYQGGLLKSPFIVVNEGWPTRAMARHPADVFRALVSADTFYCNEKFEPRLAVNTPYRIIFTANNTDVVKQLSGNRDLSPEDREALSVRLTHMRIGDDTSDWLRSKGGNKLTAKPGARWIKGDAGEQSDYVVAKHFLWLWQNRKGPVGTRLLVEGSGSQAIMEEMRTQSGSSPVVIETLLHLLDKRNNNILMHEGEVYVSAADVLSHHREEYQETTREKLSVQTIVKVFRGICKKTPATAFIVKGKESAGRKRWYQLDCDLLKTVAERDGWKCAMLDRILKEQEARFNGTFDAATFAAADIGLANQAQSPRVINFSLAARELSQLSPKVVAGEGAQA